MIPTDDTVSAMTIGRAKWKVLANRSSSTACNRKVYVSALLDIWGQEMINKDDEDETLLRHPCSRGGGLVRDSEKNWCRLFRKHHYIYEKLYYEHE